MNPNRISNREQQSAKKSLKGKGKISYWNPLMNDSKPQISSEQLPEVFALAARLQEQQEHYSLSELTQIGAEANIQPEFIHQAVQQIQATQVKQSQTRQWQQSLKVGLISFGVVLGLGVSAGYAAICGSTMEAETSQQEQSSW